MSYNENISNYVKKADHNRLQICGATDRGIWFCEEKERYCV